ncbi:MsnO8 family LLM class oxidoreductase [Ornithinibacillus contaminans]|uniref:MsnO8 family LLM class oxidoreductase n=1 Tax=Ornithinibacillus contaminans TaxID=694055 RepID=UPI00064DF94B|nr:MsnO8 family LLM class oxidoreductase [Ornithinibacillus contaminans]
MKLSILDQAPIAIGKSTHEALLETINLAKLGEELGYNRYWIAEHHDLNGLVCPAPEVMLSAIGGKTDGIRIGAGAILLPHYKPFKVAETFNMLATLYPDRIDLGIGRSPGGSAEASIALSGNFLENVRNMPVALDELLHFIHQDFEASHMFSKIKPTPIPPVAPDVWLLGTSEKSAILAADKGMAYAFGHFMTDYNAESILKMYKKNFREKHPSKASKLVVAVHVICADTMDEAENIAWKQYSRTTSQPTVDLNVAVHDQLTEFKSKTANMIIGNPKQVKEKLVQLSELYEVEEFMILTNTSSYIERNKSYELLAKEILTS